MSLLNVDYKTLANRLVEFFPKLIDAVRQEKVHWKQR